MTNMVRNIDVDGKVSEREMTSEEMASIRADQPMTRIGDVKTEAQRRILARYSFAAQSNLNMRANELNDIRFERVLTSEEEVERQQLKSIAAWIKSVRDVSDLIEARLAVDPYLDPSIQPDWP